MNNKFVKMIFSLAGGVLAFSFLVYEVGAQSKPELVPNRLHAQMAHLLESATQIDDLVWVGIMAGVPDGQLQSVLKDMKVKMGGEKLPQVRLQSDEFLFCGRRTGIQIISYKPFNISFRGKIWSYARHQTQEENYKALNFFLTRKGNAQKARSALLEELFPRAHAGADSRSVDSEFASAMWTMAVPYTSFAAMAGASGALGWIGGIAAVAALPAVYAMSKKTAQDARRIEAAQTFGSETLCQIAIESCDEKGVRLSHGRTTKNGEVEVDAETRTIRAQEGGKLYDPQDFSDLQRDGLLTLAQNCRDGQMDWKARWESARKMACASNFNIQGRSVTSGAR